MEFSRTNENEIIIENEILWFFPNQNFVEKEPLTEITQENINLQTYSNAIENEEMKTKLNFQKLHGQREKWKVLNRNALCWSYYTVNENNIVDGRKP